MAFILQNIHGSMRRHSLNFSAVKWASLRKPMLSGKFFYRQFRDHFLLDRNMPVFYQNFHKSRLAGAEVNYKVSSALGITRVNLRYRHEKIFSTVLGEPLKNPIPVNEVSGVFYDMAKSRSYLSYTLDHTIQFGKFLANTGLLAHSGIDGLVSPGIYPGIDLAYSPATNMDLVIHGSINRSMRLPSFTDLYYSGPQNQGNSDLHAEKALTSQLGLDLQQGGFGFQAETFYRIGTETIDWVWQDSLWHTMNYTRLDSYGFGLSTTYEPEAPVQSNISFKYIRVSYSYTQVNKPKIDYISHYALDHLRHKVNATIRLRLFKKAYAALHFTYQERNGSFLYYETHASQAFEKPYEPYALMDASMGMKLWAVDMYVELKNLLNTEYYDIGNIPMPGRWFSVGINYRY